MSSLRSSNENLSRNDAQQRSRTVQAHTYQLHLDFMSAVSENPTHFELTTTLQFTAVVGSETFLDYVDGIVEQITLNGREVPVNDAVDGARIYLRGLEAENTVTIRSKSAYSRSGEGVHYFKDPTDGQVYLYSQNEPADCRRIYPCFDQPDQKARFSVSITAPSDWHVDANGSLEATEDHGDGSATRSFTTTEPMSTYITTFLAGPYATWQDHYNGTTASGVEVSVPLQLACRASIAEHLDHEELFTLTKQGLDWFHTHFDYAYPWGDYHQVFVPEYNLGAMENPGLVTFTEAYVFTSAPTLAQHEGRANTLMHEMSHMWFGDLVTMTWWDDLWLKESFADYIGTLVVDEATDFTTAWTTFASRRKGWAYTQDQYPTTHPIMADIVDLEAADQNFDGITYAKGASVLKQLAAYVGQDAFLQASRTYFQRHAWGNTTLDDFLVILSEASGRDMQAWAEAWLNTSGPSSLWVETETDADGVVTSAVVMQQGTDPVTGKDVVRPQVLNVGLFEAGEAADADAAEQAAEPARLVEAFEVRLEGESAPVPELVGRTLIAGRSAVLPNQGDLTYAKVRLEGASLDVALTVGLDSELDRATALAAAWNMTRDGDLPAERFIDGVVANSALIEDSGVLATVLGQAGIAVRGYTTKDQRAEIAQRWLTFLLTQVLEEEVGSDRRLVFTRSLLYTAARVAELPEGLLDVVESWLQDKETLGEELTWASLTVLAAHGRATAEDIEAEHRRKPTQDAACGLREALAARPDAEVKKEIRANVYVGKESDGTVLSNDYLQAYADGLGIDPARKDQPEPAEYWERIESVWASMSQGQATRVVEGLFPGAVELADGDLESNPEILRARRWLDGSTDAPAALRRLILEELDDAERRLAAQAASSKA